MRRIRRLAGGICLCFGVLAAVWGFGACTKNQIARQYGGEIRIPLPPGEKLVMATWKGEDSPSLWYLTRPAHPGEVPETLMFREQSAFGVWEGQVVFVETAPTSDGGGVPAGGGRSDAR